MATVKYAVSAYTADGVTTDYLITWDYLDEDHITVYVDGTSNADPAANHTFTKLNNTTLRITDGVGGAIVSGAEIEIRRETPLLTRAITFADGSALLAEDLNKNSDYLLYSMQEVLDTVDAAAQDGALAAEVATQALRDEAEDLRDDTLVARNTTQTYLATVQSDATDADNHRIAAAASETAAAASEAASAASEAASAASEVAAAASQVAAATSETNAAASEAASAASEAAAAASETAAAASEVAAASSETNAEAAWDSLDDRYLGAKATAPTLDNDGDALQTGALYWNSTSDTMYVWNGTTWDTFNSTTGIADGAASTAMTLDSSGNVLVGKTVGTYTTDGIALQPNGSSNFSRSTSSASNSVVAVNRNNSDGTLVTYSKDGTTVGSISTDGGGFTVQATQTGYGTLASTDGSGYNWYTNGASTAGGSIYPSQHNVRDIGENSVRFRNGYFGSNVDASGSVYSSGGASQLLGYSTLRGTANFALSTSASDIYTANQGIIPTGTYILLVTLNGSPWYGETWVGLMRWYNSGTNSNNATDIYMTGMGHASNGGVLYARVQRRGGNQMTQSIQIWSNFTGTYSISAYAKRLT